MLPANTQIDFRKVDQLNLWRTVLNIPLLEIGQKFCNPLRLDRRAGCRLYEWNGFLYLQDYGHPIFHGKTVFAIAKFIGTKLEIDTQNQPNYPKKDQFKINYFPKEFTSIDKLYWEQYGISTSQLKSEKIDSVYQYSYRDKEVYPADLTYAINVEDRVKIYRPYNEFRFLADFTGKEVGGMTKLVSEPIFTKSAKDYMVLCNFGYSSRYIHSESVKNPPIGIYLVDNDVAGKNYAEYLRTIGCTAFTLPDNYPKDISDCVKELGYDESSRILKSTLELDCTSSSFNFSN
jgi:hypothetical protein